MHWQLTESSATGSVGTGHIEVFPTQPDRPACLQIGQNEPKAWEFAAVCPSPQHSQVAEEIYSRQRDLICRYRQTESDSFAFQLDWQLIPPNGPFALGAELWLSVQTGLLDTHPELNVTCHALGGDATVKDCSSSQFGDHSGWRMLAHPDISDEALAGDAEARGPAAMICSGQAGSGVLTGLWLIEPTDQRHAQLCPAASKADSGGTALSVRLFGHFMEKGVIRRGRMRFLLADRALIQADIVEAYRQFAHSPLPLTA